ncbi:MAG: type II toxin-antitoxin system VapC family toxin [Anaerolineae bacterium]|nr:type II toxin-antitoxin system VapC family toxin [Anaerolineae bacterium]
MRIVDALQGVRRLAVETAPLIYLVERHPVYVARMRSIMREIDTGTLAGVTSVVTLTEVLTMPLKTGRPDIAQAYRNILIDSRHFTLVAVDVAIAEHAAELRARHNLRTPDALQVATALQTGCDAFLTNDLGIKRVDEVRVLILDELELDTSEIEEAR